MIGRRLLHYEVVEKLGVGGMGVVYKARDTHLDRFVAIKVLPPEKVADPGRKARFVQEAKAASALNHPNIIIVHDISQADGVTFIAMECVEGKTLDQLIGRRRLNLNDALRYAIQIADALSRAHAASIIHRDLKPANIMVDEHGLVKVLDFGLAKLSERVADEFAPTETLKPQTKDGTIVGTAGYMSPEQAEGKKLDARSDIFSFGSVLYEMVTGQRAFRGDSQVATLSAVLHKEPAPLPAEVPQELGRIVARCLRKDPERRFQHVDDIKISLQELKDESDSGKLAPERAVPRRTPARTITLAAAAAVMVLVVAVLAVWRWYSRAGPAAPALLDAVPISTYPGGEASPSFSPDGTQLAFQWCKGKDCHIYVKQIGIEEPYRLTNGSEADAEPEWSPDGAYIAFTRVQRDGERIQYILIPQRGGPQRVISDFAAPRRLLAQMSFRRKSWCPDSKSLVVVSPERESGVGLDLISMAGGENRRLTDLGALRSVDAFPAVSPDGQWLAFTRHASESQGDLYVLRLSSGCSPQGAPVKLETGGQAKWNTGWTRDGRELLYSSGDYVRSALFRITPTPPWTPVQVPVSGFNTSGFAVSRQGRLAFSRSIPNTHLWRITAAQPGGHWRAPERFSSSTQFEIEPQYSPDGERVAFDSHRSGQSQIWVSDRNGANLMQLTFLEGFGASRPRWSPDGRWIAFKGTVVGNRDIYVVASGGGPLRRLTDHPAQDTNPEWSCDGKYVEFQSDRDPAVRRWRVPVAGGEAEKRKTERRNWAADSPDCQAVFYGGGVPGRETLLRKPVAGGDAAVVTAALYPTAGWQIFSDGIYYVGQSVGGGPSPILYRDFATGKTRQLASIPSPYWGFTVAPDRRSIIYANSVEPESDLMLVEKFR